jgi:hypothetical protein
MLDQNNDLHEFGAPLVTAGVLYAFDNDARPAAALGQES